MRAGDCPSDTASTQSRTRRVSHDSSPFPRVIFPPRVTTRVLSPWVKANVFTPLLVSMTSELRERIPLTKPFAPHFEPAAVNSRGSNVSAELCRSSDTRGRDALFESDVAYVTSQIASLLPGASGCDPCRPHGVWSLSENP